MGFPYSTAGCIAFNAHVNHIACSLAAAAPGKSRHGRKMSGVGNAQFWNHDATIRCVVACLPQNLSHIWREHGRWRIDLYKNVCKAQKNLKNTCLQITHLVILGGKVFWLQKSDQSHLPSSLRPDIDILGHDTVAMRWILMDQANVSFVIFRKVELIQNRAFWI